MKSLVYNNLRQSVQTKIEISKVQDGEAEKKEGNLAMDRLFQKQKNIHKTLGLNQL